MSIRGTLAVVSALGCLGWWAAAAQAEDYVHERAGLANCFRQFDQPDSYTGVVYLGGSITAGQGPSRPDLGYASQTTRCLRGHFPKAGMGEAKWAAEGGSWFGAFRTWRAGPVYGATIWGAGVVFVEFAVDDRGAPEQRVGAAMEGIVRQVLTANPATDVVLVYTLAREHLDAFRDKQLPKEIQWHERIAEHYGVASVNLAQFAAAKILARELTFDEFSKDGIHPTDRGSALYAEAMKAFVERCLKSAPRGGAPARRKLPPPLCSSPMEKAQFVPYEQARREGHWKLGQPSPVEPFRHLLVSDRPGATISLRFRGAAVGCFDVVGPDTGDYESSLDGGPWQPLANFNQRSAQGVRPSVRRIAEGLDPKVRHEVRLRIAEKQPAGSAGRFARIGCLLVDGDVDDPYQGMTPLARIDAIYGAMDPLNYAPPAGRWQRIPKTMQRLRDGGALRIVLLGDSIVNQTAGSGFHLLLERMYPKCKIEEFVSVRGSTGCWWYKDENRVEEYVLRHRPDLLMIGGISQRDDVDSIRAVIRQVRAKQSPEILLMTPAFGFDGSSHITQWTYAVDPRGTDYRARLHRLADEEKCEFLDMTGPWWQYIKDSGKCYGWFRGDAVHANDRGSQILARILEKYFRP